MQNQSLAWLKFAGARGAVRAKTELNWEGGKKNTLQVPNPPVLCSIFKMTVGSKTPLCFVIGKIHHFPRSLGWSFGINRGGGEISVQNEPSTDECYLKEENRSHICTRAIFKCLWLLVQYPAPKLGLPQSSHHADFFLVAWETSCFSAKNNS